MPEKVTVEFDKVTETLIFLDESGKKLVGVRPSVFYHQPVYNVAGNSEILGEV